MWNYVLNLRSRMVAVRLDINDVPRCDRPGAVASSLSTILNPWIVPGPNTLRLSIDWPEGVSYEAGRARVELCLEARPNSPGAAEVRVLAKREWPGSAEEAYPAAQLIAFDVAEAPPGRLWPNAAPIELTPEAQSTIRQLVTRIHGALAARDVDRSAELLDFRTVDIGQSLHTPHAEARRGQRELLEELLAPDAVHELAPLDPETLELHPVAGGRLIWVTRPDRAAALAIDTPDGPLGMPLFVARINDQWTIVR